MNTIIKEYWIPKNSPMDSVILLVKQNTNGNIGHYTEKSIMRMPIRKEEFESQRGARKKICYEFPFDGKIVSIEIIGRGIATHLKVNGKMCDDTDMFKFAKEHLINRGLWINYER